jgi:hypothetical protein
MCADHGQALTRTGARVPRHDRPDEAKRGIGVGRVSEAANEADGLGTMTGWVEWCHSDVDTQRHRDERDSSGKRLQHPPILLREGHDGVEAA